MANWGNLVNRTLTSAYKNFGAVPGAGRADSRPISAVMRQVEAGFESVGELIEQARFKAALAEAMRLASTVNQYVSEQAPWETIEDDRERAGHRALRRCCAAIDNLKLLFTPFLPFSSQTLHELLGYDDVIAGPFGSRRSRRRAAAHLVLTGDYETWAGAGSRAAASPGKSCASRGRSSPSSIPRRSSLTSWRGCSARA